MARFQCQHCGVIGDTEKTSDDEWNEIAMAHRHGMYAWHKLKEEEKQ